MPSRCKIGPFMKLVPLPSRVLVVDDEPLVAGAIARMAESFGHQVVLADGVPAALQIFENDSIDVVLTDVRLGEQDGLVLLNPFRSAIRLSPSY
jgi:CheY-like chemotaxis protein